MRPLPSTGISPARRGSEPANVPLHSVRRTLRASVHHELWAGLHLSGVEPLRRLQPLPGLEPLANLAQRFTPRVSLAPPDGLLLEIAGSLHLFGGVEGLRREITAELLRFQLRPVLAFAPTPLAAITAARAGQPLIVTQLAQLVGQLAPLPIGALRWPEETRARLARAGVRTIGAVLRLPRAGFARRFGVAQLAMLDALTGRSREVRATHRAPVRFRRRHELDCELSDHGRLLTALEPLFDGPQLSALFGEHLQALQLPEPIRAFELRADQLMPLRSPRRGLWQPGEQGGETGEESEGLIDRLRARLGSESVHGLALRAEHRPEFAWAITPPPAVAPQRLAGTCAQQEALPSRPLWLLPIPQPLAAPGGLPRRRGPLRLLGEPERVETGWWDGGEVARDYYRALDRYGVRLWVFRERTEPHQWFLHGVFG